MTQPDNWERRPRQGFTLVEMLTAFAVLSLILVILGQMLSTTAVVTSLSSHQMNATQTTRLVLDGLERDFSTLLSEYGDTLCVQTSGNSVQLAFLSATRGPVGTLQPPLPDNTYRCTAITYQLTNNQIIRNTESITWAQSNPPMLELLSPTGTVQSSPVANHILAFQAVISLDNGQTCPIGYAPPGGTATWTTTTFNGQPLPNGYVGLVLSKPPVSSSTPRARTITIAVAALDGQTFQLPNVTSMNTLLLPPAVSAINLTPIEGWNYAMSQGSFSAFPKPAVAALHFDQRTFVIQ
jgi:prepilin-type N-terminal cleavage/methylation domain-containing protein